MFYDKCYKSLDIIELSLQTMKQQRENNELRVRCAEQQAIIAEQEKAIQWLHRSIMTDLIQS